VSSQLALSFTSYTIALTDKEKNEKQRGSQADMNLINLSLMIVDAVIMSGFMEELVIISLLAMLTGQLFVNYKILCIKRF